MKQITLEWDDWFDTFEPIYNPNEETHFFETYGEDVEKVKQAHADDPRKVWTEVGDAIADGWHYVNRNRYFITKHALKEGVFATVYDLDMLVEGASYGIEDHADHAGLDLNDPSERALAAEWVKDAKEQLAFARQTLVQAKDYVA